MEWNIYKEWLDINLYRQMVSMIYQSSSCLLYTSKRKVIIVGSKKAMAIAIKNDTLSKRNTMFGLRIRKIYEAYLEQEKKSA